MPAATSRHCRRALRSHRHGHRPFVSDSSAVRRHERVRESGRCRRPLVAAGASVMLTRLHGHSRTLRPCRQSQPPSGSLDAARSQTAGAGAGAGDQPSVLLLDEVAGGLTEHECQALIALIRDGAAPRRLDHLDRACGACADRSIDRLAGAARRRVHRRRRSARR